MEYQCVTSSVEGFVQQLAGCYLADGYWFYSSGRIAKRRDATEVDRMLTRQYGISNSHTSRLERKLMGIANLHYLRCERFYILLATDGHHPFFDKEKGIRDARQIPIRYGGYTVGVEPAKEGRGGRLGVNRERWKQWAVRVEIDAKSFGALQKRFVEMAAACSAAEIADALHGVPFAPYAPVVQQMEEVLWLVNQARQAGGLELVGREAVRRQRRIVSPFEPLGVENAA